MLKGAKFLKTDATKINVYNSKSRIRKVIKKSKSKA